MLTPDEIASRRFLVSLRGYDRDEVHAFLRELATQVKDVVDRHRVATEELERLRAESVRLTEQLDEQRASAGTPQAPVQEDARRPFAEIGEETQRILEAAQEAGQQITRKARHDADREVQRARREAAKSIADGERRREAIEQVVSELEGRREALAGDLGQVAQTIEQVLAGLRRDDDAPTVREALTSSLEEEQEHDTGAGDTSESVAAEADSEPVTTPEPIEAEPPEAVAEPERVTTESVEVRPSEAVADGGNDAEEDAEDPSSPTTLRVRALEPLHPKMVRRMKRGLSDLQNIALDRLRRQGPKADPDALALSDEEMATLGESGESFLEQAYRAGVESAAALAGRKLAPPGVVRELAVSFVADASVRVRDPLASTLRMGLGASEELPALNDRIGTVFSELKSAAADELSATHLIRSYELGLLDAWASGGVAHRSWVLGREPRCPEGRCRQNDQSGAVDVTEAFPSGHDVPPVHVGCTCTTIPVLES